jgi:hypothetical protein
MSRAEPQVSRLDHLLRLLCEDQLADDDATELAELLATSESARRRYVETIQLCNDLADWSQATGPIAIPYSVRKNINSEPARRKAVAPAGSKEFGPQQRRFSRQTSPPARRSGWLLPWLSWGAAAALLLVGSLWSLNQFNGKSTAPAKGSDPSAGTLAGTDRDRSDKRKYSHSGKFVARVVEVTADAKWDDNLQPREFLMRLREGDELSLLSGLAQLEFYSGARIILQGPATFVPTGPAGGKLESGRLTGKVEGGKFQLTTPSARVVDLGTEFGVTVGPSSDTDVCVFVGEVEVHPSQGKGKRESTEAYSLTQGMSVRVAATGKVSDGGFAGVNYDVYNRSFPSPANTNPDELDLVDIVCGGNGQGMRLAAAIDPLTGQWDRRPWTTALGPGTRKGDGLFHAAEWHPFIDGTFIPNKLGEPMQVDSERGTIRLPKDRGDYTWGPIWARRAVTDDAKFDRAADSWGTQTYPVITDRLKRCRLGGIGIHASVGITFDLKTIGKEHPGTITRLTGVLVNTENSKEHNPEWANSNPPPSADFRVFVDGHLRYEKLEFARNVDGLPFAVDLKPADRFLTFVTTDGGNSNRYDHIVIIDPMLLIPDAIQHRPSGTSLPTRGTHDLKTLTN